MYDKSGFLDYFANSGAAPNTCATYGWFLSRIDETMGGLDERLAEKGLEATLAWAATAHVEPFETYRSQARSVLKRYAMYHIEKLGGDEAEVEEPVAPPAALPTNASLEADANFIREKEMQVQVRQQLQTLETGLQAIDDGAETQVPTGRIDILARDTTGTLVVIELKAGKCPPGAIEQLLAYAYDVEQDRKTPTRPMLVAGAFTDRQRAAARRAGIELKTYAYSLSFQTHD